MYQMYAYITKTGAESGMLLYPDTIQGIRGTFFFDITREGHPGPEGIPLHIESISLAHDLTSKEGWNRFREELAQKTRILIANNEFSESSSIHQKFNIELVDAL
ncbi:hypothetical protein, partial [Methanocalculus sp.]|uniref:hypothetical protein n=1 Tax=Methanocalculus sp. TaxID=2004547 RepID=UPI00260C2BD1